MTWDRGLLTVLDLNAAFDAVNHKILQRRLEDAIGIKDKTLNCFRSNLPDYFPPVCVHNCSSERKSVSYGVPQGSVLGPMLLYIYVSRSTS